MKLRRLTAASVLTVAGTLAASGVDGTPQESGKALHTLQSTETSQSKPTSLNTIATQSRLSVADVHSTFKPVIPKKFSPYASVVIGDNLRCIAGAVTDEDGMNQRPYVYVTSMSMGNVKWVRALDVPEGFYESRATHCIRKDDAIYVLIQYETQSQQTLSQTVLQVAKINPSNGAFEGGRDIAIPGVKGAYSAWVRKGEENFRLVNDELLMTGKYHLFDMDEPISFHVWIKNW